MLFFPWSRRLASMNRHHAQFLDSHYRATRVLSSWLNNLSYRWVELRVALRNLLSLGIFGPTIRGRGLLRLLCWHGCLHNSRNGEIYDCFRKYQTSKCFGNLWNSVGRNSPHRIWLRRRHFCSSRRRKTVRHFSDVLLVRTSQGECRRALGAKAKEIWNCC